jgi:hypothetical protein
MKLEHASTWNHGIRAAQGAMLAALFCACGGSDSASSGSTVATSDTASAYEALSASLAACADDKDACVTAAAGDASKLAACDTEEAGCKKKTEAASNNVRQRFCDDAEGCVRGRHCDDEDAGTHMSCGPQVHECIQGRAPSGNADCMRTLFTCLDDTGIRESNAQTQLDDKTREAIVACVQTAHECIVDEMASARQHGGGRGPGGPGIRGGAGHAGGHDGHDFAGSGPIHHEGGAGGDDGFGRGRNHPFAGAAPGHDEAGAGPGRRHDEGGAGGDDGLGRRGRDRAAGGAGGS